MNRGMNKSGSAKNVPLTLAEEAEWLIFNSCKVSVTGPCANGVIAGSTT